MSELHEGCKLVAETADEGMCLTVVNKQGETIATLDWPKQWPEVVTDGFLEACGFHIS